MTSKTDLLAFTEEWVSETDFARALGVSRRSIMRYRQQPNGLPYSILGGRVRIHVPSARAWLERRIVHPNPTRAGRAGK